MARRAAHQMKELLDDPAEHRVERLTGVGVSDEWHVDFSKAFQHITFGLPSWFHETIVWFGSTFFSARLITVGPIGDAMDRDGVKQLLVEVHAECQVMLALESNHWLEGFERLDRSLEAD